jgi:sulfur relay protein TusB/DsrH
MSILYMVNQPDRLWDCLARISDGDAILLLHEGVLSAVDAVHLASFPAMSMHILCEHATLTREIEPALGNRFELIDFVGFVSLTEQHETTIFWG